MLVKSLLKKFAKYTQVIIASDGSKNYTKGNANMLASLCDTVGLENAKVDYIKIDYEEHIVYVMIKEG